MNQISDILAEKAQEYGTTLPDPVPASPSTGTVVQSNQPGSEQAEDTSRAASHRNTASPSETVDASELREIVLGMQDQLNTLLNKLGAGTVTLSAHRTPRIVSNDGGDSTIVEGVFDGQSMIGPDGKTYPIPPNYASKSKLVEGDLMKLTIAPSGRYIFKQIAPVGRKRIVGELIPGEQENQYAVFAEGKTYKILFASVTFHKAVPGDDVVILVPEDAQASWGAVEHVIKK